MVIRVNWGSVFKVKPVLVICLSFVSCFIASCSLESVYAEQAELSMSISSGDVSMTLIPNGQNSVFGESSPTTVSVSTSNRTGYTLRIFAANSTELVGESSSFSSITEAVSENDFRNPSNSSLDNKWGYRPSMFYSESNSSFIPSPSTSGHILDITSSSNNVANIYTITVGARANSTTKPGAYSNTFVITATANLLPLDVTYNGNGLYFNNDPSVTTNLVSYDSNSSVPLSAHTITRYSSTPNLDFGGNQESSYTNNYAMNDVVQVAGASSLHIKLTYGGESASYDWVSFWAGNYPSYTAADNYSTGIQNCGGGTVTNGRYGGGTGTTVECDISGDTVTFAFKSDGSGVGNGYGYYAVITGDTNLTDKFSHTPNVNNQGVQTGEYSNSYTKNEVITISGASTLHISLTYGGESASYDWVSFWAGNYPSYTAADNYSTGIQNCGGGTVTNGKYGGEVRTTVECDISGDTVTFAFKSDTSVVGSGYGYYARITGVGPILTYPKTAVSGTYSVPATSGTYVFLGWSEDQNAKYPEYTNEAEIPYLNDNSITLYAVWADHYTCTKRYRYQAADGTYPKNYTVDATEQIAIGGTCTYTKTTTDYDTATKTATMNSDVLLSVDLPRKTYTLTINKNSTYISSTTGAGTYRWGQSVSIKATPKSTGVFNGWSQTSGTTGTFGNASSATTTFTMGKGPATIYADGKTAPTFEAVYTAAGKQKVDGYLILQEMTTSICNAVDVGQTEWFKDSRDNKNYHVSKLADGKCWLIDNLRLDLSSLTLSDLAGKTNATSTSLNYLLNGGGSSPYASSAVNNGSSWTGSYTSAEIYTFYESYVASTRLGSSMGLYGMYYNYCAASAGSYCYPNGQGVDNPNSLMDATQDICPTGWRLPTAGSSEGDYYTLKNSYSSDIIFANKFAPTITGWFSSGGVQYDDMFVNYHSSTAHTDGAAMLYLNVTYDSSSGYIRVYTDDNLYRHYGSPIRCVSK